MDRMLGTLWGWLSHQGWGVVAIVAALMIYVGGPRVAHWWAERGPAGRC